MSTRAYQIPPYWGYSLQSEPERQAWIDEVRRNGGNTIEIGTFHGVSACQLAAAIPERQLYHGNKDASGKFMALFKKNRKS